MKDVLIRNCRFAFKCDKTWNSLIETDDELIRYCDSCDRGVHYCNSDEQLVQAITNNKCIAIKREYEDHEGETIYENLVGDVVLTDYSAS